MHLVWFVMTVGMVGCDTRVTLTSYLGRCIPIGQRLLINCTIHGDKENNGKLFIKKGDQRLSVITDMTSSMVSLNTIQRQHGMYYYTCCSKQCSDEGEFDSGIFEVGGESHDPLNFQCVIRNTRVSCSFEMHDSCVEWALSYHMSGESVIHKGTCKNSVRKSLFCVELNDERQQSYRSLTKRCQDRHKEIQTTCLLPDAVRDVQYLIHVERRSPFTTTSFQYNITTNVNIEQMGSLRSFKVNSTSSTTATLTWRFPNNPAYYRYGITCTISHSTSQSTTQCWESGKDVRYTIEQLKPFRSYTIQVRCRFTESQYWSQISTAQCSTQQDVPMYGPQGTPTSYDVYQNKNKTSTLAFYIKPPLSDTINGVLTGYALQVNTSQTVLTRRFPVTTTLTIDDIPGVTMGLYADIWSLTVVGKSRDSLHFNIDPTDIGFHRVDVVSVTEFSDHHHFLVTIQHNHIALSDTHFTYIYHWCQTNSQDYDCNDRGIINCTAHYEFAYSNESQKAIVIPMESQWNHSWVFGASVLSAGSARGIRWEKCTLPYGWSNTSVSYSLTKKEQPLYALIALAPGIVVIAAIFYFVRKKIKRDCTAYDFELPGVEHVEQQRDTVVLSACESICRLGHVKEEPEEVLSSEYSRLHPTGHGLPGDSGVMSFVGPIKASCSWNPRVSSSGVHTVKGDAEKEDVKPNPRHDQEVIIEQQVSDSRDDDAGRWIRVKFTTHQPNNGKLSELQETANGTFLHSEYSRLHPGDNTGSSTVTSDNEFEDREAYEEYHKNDDEEQAGTTEAYISQEMYNKSCQKQDQQTEMRKHLSKRSSYVFIPGDSRCPSRTISNKEEEEPCTQGCESDGSVWTEFKAIDGGHTAPDHPSSCGDGKVTRYKCLEHRQETAKHVGSHKRLFKSMEIEEEYHKNDAEEKAGTTEANISQEEYKQSCQKQDQQTEMRKSLNERSSYVCIPGDSRCPSRTISNKEEEEEPCTQGCESEGSVWTEFKAIDGGHTTLDHPSSCGDGKVTRYKSLEHREETANHVGSHQRLFKRSSYVCIPGDSLCPSRAISNKGEEEEPCTQLCESSYKSLEHREDTVAHVGSHQRLSKSMETEEEGVVGKHIPITSLSKAQLMVNQREGDKAGTHTGNETSTSEGEITCKEYEENENYDFVFTKDESKIYRHCELMDNLCECTDCQKHLHRQKQDKKSNKVCGYS